MSSKRRKQERKKEVNSSPVYYKPNKVKPRTKGQRDLIKSIYLKDITFCVGPAGSGKTHISIGAAIGLLQNNKIDRLVLVRPIIEAGQKDNNNKSRLGYLPGTMEEKMSPFIRPLNDELSKFVNLVGMDFLRKNNKIEICPLEQMRGRTFENCFIICDEAQNATEEQLKMLLTRLGLGSKMVLVGDVDQSDLPSYLSGGFENMIDDLEGLNGLGLVYLEACDIQRHPLVAAIVQRLKERQALIERPASLKGIGYESASAGDQNVSA